MIAILDFGVGNLLSINNMLKKIGAQSEITSDLETIKKAAKLILPGIGNFEYCMSQLQKAHFYDLFQTLVQVEKIPVLGVCVGCQMLMESSEEGNVQGLGWIKGKVVKFDTSKLPSGYKVPHMGWTEVEPKKNNYLYNQIEEARFYFVHSYHLLCDNVEDVSGTATYGYTFAASVAKDNIMGVQFHPEKSHKYGMQLYSNFVNKF